MTTPEELTSLKRIEELLTALVRRSLVEELTAIRADKEQRFLYDNTGRLPVKELAKNLKWSVGTISRTWKSWEDAGLVVKDGKQYRKTL